MQPLFKMTIEQESELKFQP